MAKTTNGKRLRDIIGDQFGAAIVEENLEKALSEMKSGTATAPQSVFYDSVSMFMGSEWMPRRSEGLTMTDLRGMAKNPIVGSIIATRKNQVAAFCYPQRDEYSYGYVINNKNATDDKDIKQKEYLSDWIATCGLTGFGESMLETWVRKFVEDSLILDQATTEVINLRNKEPGYLVSVDAATVRRLEASLNYANGPEDPLYVQIMNERIVAQYTANQMIFGIRNPKTDVSYCGYGMSELEVLIRTVSTIVNTERYNSGQLTQGGIQKGILVVKGDADKSQVETFKRDFRETIRNAASYWRPPVLHVNKDSEVDWVTLDRSQKDMEYSLLFEFLVKQACGIYQIDPTEINWSTAASGVTAQYNGNNDDKVRNSQYRGLNPLLVFVSNQINTNLLNRLDPRFQLDFNGLDRDRKTDMQMIKDQTSTYKTVNEVRIDHGMKPLTGGDVILSDVFIKSVQGPDMGMVSTGYGAEG